jgi:hypothetical protein
MSAETADICLRRLQLARQNRMKSIIQKPLAIANRLLARTFRRDVFISYSHAGAERYATALAAQFRAQGWWPFFDGFETRPFKESVEDWLSWALRRSQILVIIAEPEAFNSRWVAWEVKTFATGKADALLLAISIGHTLSDEDLSESSFMLLRNRLHLTEDADAFTTNRPSAMILTEIERSLSSIRRSQLMRRMMVLAVAAIVVAFVAGVIVGRLLS